MSSECTVIVMWNQIYLALGRVKWGDRENGNELYELIKCEEFLD